MRKSGNIFIIKTQAEVFGAVVEVDVVDVGVAQVHVAIPISGGLALITLLLTFIFFAKFPTKGASRR